MAAVTVGERGRLAFVDDEIDTGVPAAITKALQQAGFTVASFKTGLALLEAMRSGFAPDVILADWELLPNDGSPDAPASGLDVARDVVREFGPCRVCIATRYRGRIPTDHLLDPRVPVRIADKPTRVKAVEGWVTSDLLPVLMDLVNTPFEIGTAPLVFRSDQGIPALFRRSAAEAAGMAETEYRNMRLEAYLAVEAWCAGIFAVTRAQWLAVACSDDSLVIARWGRSSSAPLSVAEVRQLEVDTQHPVLVVGRPPRMEEISTGGWTACEYGEVADDLYPSILIEIHGGERSFHFDTGSVQSFLDYRVISSHPDIGDYSGLPWEFSRMSVRGASKPYEYTWSPIVEFHAPDGDGHTIRIPFQLVIDWDEAPISLVCARGACAGSTPLGSGGYLCGKRSGLIGRDLLRSNPDLHVVLDCRARTTRMVHPEREAHRRYFRRA